MQGPTILRKPQKSFSTSGQATKRGGWGRGGGKSLVVWPLSTYHVNLELRLMVNSNTNLCFRPGLDIPPCYPCAAGPTDSRAGPTPKRLNPLNNGRFYRPIILGGGGGFNSVK